MKSTSSDRCRRSSWNPLTTLTAAETAPKLRSSFRSKMNGGCTNTPQKRKLRSDSSSPMKPRPVSSPMKCKLARRNLSACINTLANGIEKYFSHKKPQAYCKPPVVVKPNWNPRDKEQMRIVKEALHLSTVPSSVACRDVEQKRVLEFCKSCIEQEKAHGYSFWISSFCCWWE